MEGAPVEVWGDAVRLRQVVVNLLDNAIKYTRPGGRIEIRTWRRKDRGVLQITDNGIGIPSHALPHVFERFYRADKARSRASGGVGLGLSIVKAICSAHGGVVFAESTEGRGTSLTVELPLVSYTHRGEREDAGEGDRTGSVTQEDKEPWRQLELEHASLQAEEPPIVVPSTSSCH
jgi:signal transduction histidine kinase